MTYNGSKNYETWAAWLWITSDESAYNLAKSAKSPDELALMLEAANPFDDVSDMPFGGLYFDIVENGLQAIDYCELFYELNGDDEDEDDDDDDGKKTSRETAAEAPCVAVVV